MHDTDLGVPGKTGILDDSVLLDNLVHLSPLFQLIREFRAVDQPLFSFDFQDFSARFHKMVPRLGLDPLAPNLYALRHGGASEDLRNRHRSPMEVQLRGRWRTATSLRRYGKATRLMTQLAKVPEQVQAYGTTIENDVLNMIQAAGCGNRLRIPAPPRIP